MIKEKEWVIFLPWDIVPDQFKNSEKIEYLNDFAIKEARELADDWVIPCQWESQLLNDLDSVEFKLKVKRIWRV